MSTRTRNMILLTAFVVLWIVSCLGAHYPQDLVLQHIPTALAVPMLLFAIVRWRVRTFDLLLMLGFLCLHLLGARYLYSYVPYDAWCEAVLGVGINETFGWERNHYDRLVHLCFGLLLAPVCFRLSAEHLRLNRLWSVVFAVLVIMGASAAYEIVEWAIAVVMAPNWAERYNGQQGDFFDAQKDMALATVGAVITGLLAAVSIKPTRPSSYSTTACERR